MPLESVYLPLAVSTMFIKVAVFAGRKVVAQAVKAFGNTNVSSAFLARLAKLLMVLVVVAFATFGASKDI